MEALATTAGGGCEMAGSAVVRGGADCCDCDCSSYSSSSSSSPLTIMTGCAVSEVRPGVSEQSDGAMRGESCSDWNVTVLLYHTTVHTVHTQYTHSTHTVHTQYTRGQYADCHLSQLPCCAVSTQLSITPSAFPSLRRVFCVALALTLLYCCSIAHLSTPLPSTTFQLPRTSNMLSRSHFLIRHRLTCEHPSAPTRSPLSHRPHSDYSRTHSIRS